MAGESGPLSGVPVDPLTEAIAAGSGDPRALYFRGLAARRMGRIDEAEADFSQAATLEASGLGAWPVSRTLERVQGADRLAGRRPDMVAVEIVLQQHGAVRQHHRLRPPGGTRGEAELRHGIGR